MGFWDTLGKIGKGAAMAFPVTGLPMYAAAQLAKGNQSGPPGKSRAIQELDKNVAYQRQQAAGALNDLSTYGGQAMADMAARYGYGPEGEAGANRPGRDAQLAAIANYQALTDPQMTAKERQMMAQAQQVERAARDANLNDLGARGMRGGGAEIANMFNAQQATATSNAAAQANAVTRSMDAIKGLSESGDRLRTSDDTNVKDLAAGYSRLGEGMANTRLAGAGNVGSAVTSRAGTYAAEEAARKAEENKGLLSKAMDWIGL